MGEYRFSAYFKWQIGFNLQYNGQVVLSLPFTDIHFAISKNAYGYNFFNKFRN